MGNKLRASREMKKIN